MKTLCYLSREEHSNTFDYLFNELDMITDKYIVTQVQNLNTFILRNAALRDTDFLLIDLADGDDVPFDDKNIIKATEQLATFSNIRPIFMLQKSAYAASLETMLQSKNIRNIIEYSQPRDVEQIMTELQECLSDMGKSFVSTTNLHINGMQQEAINLTQARVKLMAGQIIEIGIAGTTCRCGCTTQSFLIYDYCERAGLVPLIVEISLDFFEKLKITYNERENILGILEIEGKRICISPPESNKFNVLIYDYGELLAKTKLFFSKSDIPILLTPTKPWNLGDISTALTLLGGHFFPILWLSFCTADEFSELTGWDKLKGYKAACVPYTPSFFHVEDMSFFHSNLLPELKRVANDNN